MSKAVVVFILFLTSISFAADKAKFQASAPAKKVETVQKKKKTTTTASPKKSKIKRKKIVNEPIKVRRMKSFKSKESVKEKNRAKLKK